MSTLAETAYYTRRSINWFILAIIFYIILRIFWAIFVAIWLNIFPPKPPPPNHKFNVLPALKFPEQASPSGQLEFRLETIEGSVPAQPDIGTVYFMPKAAPNLLALTRTQAFVQKLEFDPDPIAETKNIYRFDDPESPIRKLRYDIVSNNFVLRYGYEQDTGLFLQRGFSSGEEVKLEAISVLESLQLYQDDYKNGTNVVSFNKLVGDKLIDTTSLSQADAVRVDFFRKNIDEKKVYTPNPNKGPIYFIYSGSGNSKKRLIDFTYTYWPIDYETSATYALKPGSMAWEELQNGRGFIARYPNSGNTAIVRQISLGYYDTYEPQNYLQPIFVFEGDYGFLGYVPAVVDEWIEK